MSPPLHRRHMPVLSLLFGLSLHAMACSAASNDTGAAPTLAPEIVVKSTVAPAAKTAKPAKQTRAPNRGNTTAERRMRQALEQVAGERETEKRAQRIRDLLARAQLDYSEGRVFEPPNNNAATHYQEVLSLDPLQAQALAGTRRIADILAAEAERAALAGDQPRTLQYILQIRALQPRHSSLQGLDARYQALLVNPVMLSSRQKDRYNRSAQSIDEAYGALKNQPIGLITLDEVIDEYDRAEGLVAQAPGLPKLEDRIILAFPAATRAELANAEPRRALRLVQMARKRGWFTQELEPLEEQARREIKAQLGQFPSPP
jgi:hypothetical protein